MARTILSLAALAVASACAGDGVAPIAVEREALPSPAGEGSGEPFLSWSDDGVYLSWLEAADEGSHDLRFARFDGAAWSEARTIASSGRFFVNWADFPSIRPGPDGSLWAHWLERGAAGGYDYAVRVTRSGDGGASWSEPRTLHDDRSPTEHGFVSAAVTDDGVTFLWLDGRRYAEGVDGGPPTSEMTLRHRTVAADGSAGPETLVDGRVCDCCQTATAMTAAGPVTVYRDRSEEEIRDIYVTRLVDGVWTEGVAVHDDGWEIAGCPVNGPAVAAEGMNVAVAWFTGADGVGRTKVAFSGDGARTFSEPVVVDDGNPAGRVDLLMVEGGTVLVSWLEHTDADAAEIRMRRVDASGSASRSVSLVDSSGARASGFPRLAPLGDGSVLLAWTDLAHETSRVRLMRVRLGA